MTGAEPATGADRPNVARAAWSIGRSLVTTRRPHPTGTGGIDEGDLAAILARFGRMGPGGLAVLAPELDRVIERHSTADPDGLSSKGALAFWINLYNAGALRLASVAAREDVSSVLRIPGGFDRPFVSVAGERLSLDAIEHAKIRRFGDPRIHGALVCGSVSCPTLRLDPYSAARLDVELDDQMRSFLRRGGISVDPGTGSVILSRVFRWYGGDFVRPHRMPTFLPASKESILGALAGWLDGDPAAWAVDGRAIEFASYDWGLRCSVG